jgi:hypothetical protein
MDAVAALLMSANGELDNPGQSETRAENILDQSIDKGVESGSDLEESKRRTVPLPVCLACRGRFVIHICTKKEKPVDYEEIAKADEERKEKEEEEKRKVRAEKRRLADAKRREARKKKKIEEDTKCRQEEVERVRFDKESRQQEAERSRLLCDDKDRRRADMLLRLQAEQERSSVVDSPSVVQYTKERKPKSPVPYQQGYSKRHAAWPLPSGHDESVREVPTQKTTVFSADWPPPSNNDHATTAPFVADWPRPVRMHSSNAANTSEAYYHGAQGWPPVASDAVSQVETITSQRQHDYAVSAPLPGPEASGNVASGEALSYSTSFYKSTPASVGSVSSGRYYSSATGSATYDAPAPSTRRLSQDEGNKKGQAYSSSYYTSAPTNDSNLYSDSYSRSKTVAAYEDVAAESVYAAGGYANQESQIYASSSYRLGADPDVSESIATGDNYYSSEPVPADQCNPLGATGAASEHSDYYSSAPVASKNDEGRLAESSGQSHAYSNNFYNEGQRARTSLGSDPSYNSVSETPEAISVHYREDEGHAGTAYGSASYYSSGTPKATSETLDPAEALASLAMFATAAPMVSVDKYADEESSYSGIGQYHHGQEVYEQGIEGGYAPNSNGWSNNNTIVDKSQQGTSN